VDLEERRRLADANLVAAFVLTQEWMGDPRGGTARFGAVDAVAVGVDVAFFNPVLALDAACTPTDLRAGLAWLGSMGLPASVQIRQDLDVGLRAAVEELGLIGEEWLTPVMVLEPIPAAPAPPGDIIIRVGGAELFDDLHAAIESGAVFQRIFGRGLLDDPRVRVAIGYLDDEPVSGATVIRSGATLGIYAVATKERARRRGIGRAVTWAAIDAGRTAWRSKIAILQSSELGVPVYRSMGFEEIARYLEYERPKDGSGGQV
jgi:GNAT superfamily N-acetyltransferase